MKIRALLVLAAGLLALSARADDWPQFRGPNRDGVSRETGLLKDWPADGPRLLWTVDTLGLGYSGPAVVGDRLYLSATRGDEEFLLGFDITGPAPRELWAARIGPVFTWKGNNWN